MTGESRWEPPASVRDALERLELDSNDVAAERWKRVLDWESGEVYFEDEGSGETRWEPPVSSASVQSEWLEARCASGEPYWLHEQSGETRWERPVARCWEDDAGHFYTDLASGESAWTLEDLGVNGTLLSQGWTTCFDDQARPYFTKETTGETKWILEAPEDWS